MQIAANKRNYNQFLQRGFFMPCTQPKNAARFCVGVAVLLCLGLFSIWVLVTQSRLNPAVIALLHASNLSSSEEVHGVVPQPAWSVATLAAPDLMAMSAPEEFDRETLADKIDGKADLYLACNFEKLRCQRFSLVKNPEEWLEWFEYDMGNVYNAFAVFSLQRRAEGQRVELMPYAYRTRNALFCVAGKYYVEVIGSSTGEDLAVAIMAMVSRYVSLHPDSHHEIPEVNLFCEEGLIPDSFALQVSTAFGFEKFRNVFTAEYNLGNGECLAFLTREANPESAAELTRSYGQFLIANGGKVSEISNLPGDAVTIELFGGTEIVFSIGPFVAGVHAADNGLAAAAVVNNLAECLRKSL